MSYDQDHLLDHDYAGDAAYERYCREHPAEPGDSDEPYDDQEWIESDGDDGDGPGDDIDDIPDEGADGSRRITSKVFPAKDPTAMISSGTPYERRLKQTADVVDRILAEGRR